MNEVKKALVILLFFYVIVLSVNISVNYSFYTSGGSWRFSILFSLITTTLGWSGYLLLYKMVFKRILDWKRKPALMLTLSVALSALYGIMIMVLAMKAWGWLWNQRDQNVFNYVNNSVYAALFTIMMGFVLNGEELLLQWKKSIRDNERLKRKMLQSQYEILKSQTNPHFFFNALNTLQALIPEDPALASRFVGALAKVFRYALQHKEEETVTVAIELKVVNAYLFLNRQRFENNLTISVEISPEAVQMKIIPHAFLMLVENAMKHNEISALHPLNLHIFNIGKDYLAVSNTLWQKKFPEASQGIGLINIVERYRLLTAVPVQVIRDNLFTVKIPLLK